MVAEFILDKARQGLEHRSLGVLRSVISVIAKPVEGIRIGEDQRIKNLMKGLWRKNPPRVKYSTTWSIDKVLDFYSRIDIPNGELSFAELTIKLALLLSISLISRAADLNCLLAENYKEMDHKLEILLAKPRKQQRSGPLEPIRYMLMRM